ncbi:MAG: leucine-rich repeat domain-containing protein [Bacteroidaceae bacterium]|nr:leucine-rich repeat domain-containing protein [Bacteroidaceae bacterium]
MTTEELDYIIINEPTPNSAFHIQFKDGDCLYFSYDGDDKTKVWVVAPNTKWYNVGMDAEGKYDLPNWQDYPQPTGKISISRKIAKYQVVGIRKFSFSDCNSLQSIVSPDSVTTIEDRAFFGCSSLQSTIIPESVTEIGKFAFFGCSSLQSIVIPDSVTKIGSDAFFGCSSLRSIRMKNPKLLKNTGIGFRRFLIKIKPPKFRK